MKILRGLSIAVVVSAAGVLTASSADAQVIYAPSHRSYAPFPYSDPSPYDQSFGTRPSFVVVPSPYGDAPRVGVVERCLYPNGWNVTDFDRDVNGIPPGIDHQCPEPASTGRVRSRY